LISCVGGYIFFLYWPWNHVFAKSRYLKRRPKFVHTMYFSPLSSGAYLVMAHLITTADGATMKLDNQKNGWKGVCVYQEANGEDYLCPVKASGQRFLHIRLHGGSAKTFLSTYWEKGTKQMSQLSRSDEPSNRRPLNSNTPPTKEYQSRKSTHICYAAEVQTHWHLQGTRTRKSKKWVAGGGQHSKSTFARNWHAMHTTCHGT
jgi:hypothetical protein